MMKFFGKVWGTVVGAIEHINRSLTFFLTKTRATDEIKTIQKKKQKAILNLGELAYNMQMNGLIDIGYCGGICDEITSYNKRLSELQTKVAQIDEEKIYVPKINDETAQNDEDDFDGPTD